MKAFHHLGPEIQIGFAQFRIDCRKGEAVKDGEWHLGIFVDCLARLRGIGANELISLFN
jgi:hypothetical protein